ncbi:transposase [Nonomuraea sp. NPDC001636]|uniref:transposase n=1 Tax=Nonomuraea sp. NPDC001636 TaxID=3154391 RepID=UPI003320D9E1
MATRSDLTDKAWDRIAPLLPSGAGPGRPWRGHRQVVNGILWRFETGSTWREIPKCYGPWQTCYERYKRWTENGTWARVLAEAQAEEDPTPPQSTILPPTHTTQSPQKDSNPTRRPPQSCNNST